jgi:hypothetical protein
MSKIATMNLIPACRFFLFVQNVQGQGAYGQNNTTTTTANDTDDIMTTEERMAERGFRGWDDPIVQDLDRKINDEKWKDCAADKTPEEEIKICYEEQGLWPSANAVEQDYVEKGEKFSPWPGRPGELIEEEEATAEEVEPKDEVLIPWFG